MGGWDGIGGEMAIAGIGALLPGGSQVAVVGSGATTALSAKLMSATGLLATADAVVNLGISMGLPMAQAKQIVRERQFKACPGPSPRCAGQYGT